jgi:hypothetical protein
LQGDTENRRAEAMSSLTELAEETGLISPDAIRDTCSKVSIRKLGKLIDWTFRALIEDGRVNPDAESVAPFTFVAGSSIRSDSGCREWDCRAEKLISLAHYAVLYSDLIILPVCIEDFLSDPEIARFALADLYFKHFLLRPLFEAGLVRFEPDFFCFCDACAQRFRAVNAMYDKAAFDFYASKLDKITVIYRPPSSTEGCFVEITGPPEYVPHGHLDLVYAMKQAPDWAPKQMRMIDGKPGARLSGTRIKKNRIGSRLFAELSRDAVFQQYYGTRFAGSYLSDSAMEAEFLGRIYPRDDLSEGMKVLVSSIGRTIPIFSDLPLRAALKIRKNEYESFLVYRSALKNILTTYNKASAVLSASEARDIVGDIIAPQVSKLRLEASAKRRSLLKKSIAKSVVPVAMVSLGVIGGLIPKELAKIFEWGAIGLSAQIAEALASLEKNPSELRNQNFYFLYRLAQEAS